MYYSLNLRYSGGEVMASISIRLSEEEKERLQKIAKEQDLTLS